MQPNGKGERPFPSADGKGRGYEPEERMEKVESDGSRIKIQDSPESPMARIGIIFPKKFEELEYRKPAEAFHRAGHELVHLEGRGKEQRQIQGGRWKIGKSIQEVSVQEFDALLIPGGYYPERLEFAEEELHFFMKFLESGKPIFGTGLKEA
jgi:hypothetical protein